MSTTLRKHARELGHKGPYYFVQDTCVRCGLTRWVQEQRLLWAKKTGTYTGFCVPCSNTVRNKRNRPWGKDSFNWKGGRFRSPDGYIRIRLAPDDPLRVMVTSGGYVREHRYLVAQAVGRPLERWEVVHHKNGIKDDNRLENLELMPNQGDHWPSVIAQGQFKAMETRIQTLEQRVLLLEAENALLQARQRAQEVSV